MMRVQRSSPLSALQRLGSISSLLILAGACSSASAPSRSNDLAFTGQTTVTTNPAAMTVAVTVTNVGTKSVLLPGGFCPTAGFFALYQDTVRSSSPVWTYPGVICLTNLPNPRTLEPGQSQTYSARYPTANPQNDGVPPSAGTYFVRASVLLLDSTTTVHAGTVTFPL
jgi:hypothetical protein